MTEIVAEISGSHGGSLDNALLLIRHAATAGADAVKFQAFIPERLAARRATRADVLALAAGVPLIDLYRRTHTPREWFPAMIEAAVLRMYSETGIPLCLAPFCNSRHSARVNLTGITDERTSEGGFGGLPIRILSVYQ